MQETTIKKSRALPRVWARFWRLKKGDQFFVGKRLFSKVGIFDSREVHPRCAVADYKFAWPWEKVRTNVLVRDVFTGGKGDSSRLPEFAKALPTRPAFDQPRIDIPTPTSCARGDAGGNFTRGGHDLMSPDEVATYNRSVA